MYNAIWLLIHFLAFHCKCLLVCLFGTLILWVCSHSFRCLSLILILFHPSGWSIQAHLGSLCDFMLTDFSLCFPSVCPYIMAVNMADKADSTPLWTPACPLIEYLVVLRLMPCHNAFPASTIEAMFYSPAFCLSDGFIGWLAVVGVLCLCHIESHNRMDTAL